MPSLLANAALMHPGDAAKTSAASASAGIANAIAQAQGIITALGIDNQDAANRASIAQASSPVNDDLHSASLQWISDNNRHIQELQALVSLLQGAQTSAQQAVSSAAVLSSSAPPSTNPPSTTPTACSNAPMIYSGLAGLAAGSLGGYWFGRKKR